MPCALKAALNWSHEVSDYTGFPQAQSLHKKHFRLPHSLQPQVFVTLHLYLLCLILQALCIPLAKACALRAFQSVHCQVMTRFQS